MSAAEDDTELRDLLLQNLENSGVLHKLKAQMRAAVFLAMEEQDRIENKNPLVNEDLKKCLNTKDGRVGAGLVVDFLKVFDLDFTLSVFEPETNAKPLESREFLCKDLGLDPNPKSPLLLELVQRRHRDRTKDPTRAQTKDQSRDLPKNQGPSEQQLQWVQKRFDFYDRDGSGSVNKDDVKRVFFDLFPQMNRKLVEQFVLEELRDTAAALSRSCDWSTFLLLHQRLFSQCLAVVTSCGDTQDTEERLSPALSQGSDAEAKGDSGLKKDPERDPGPGPGPQTDPDPQRDLDLDDVDDGDSFFDDPLPAPQKTYGWKPESPVPSLSLGRSSSSEPSRAGGSKSKDKGPKESKPQSDRSGSQRLDEEVEYDDDFNSHRSDLSRSEVSIGEEIEEVSIEGPEPSDQFEESTQDLSVSQLSHSADYMEDVP